MGILTALHTIWGRRLGALTDGSLLITKTDGSQIVIGDAPGGIGNPSYAVVANPTTGALSAGGAAGGSFPIALAGDTTKASANVAATQAALNAGGVVYILSPGIVWVNAVMFIPSNTTVYLGANTTIKLTNAANCGIFTNASARAAGTPLTSMSGWNNSAGTWYATCGFAGIGAQFPVGSYVSIADTDNGGNGAAKNVGYVGIHRVLTSSANSITFEITDTTPGDGSGVCNIAGGNTYAYPVDSNIAIVGRGGIDGNAANQTLYVGGDPRGSLIHIRNARNVLLQDFQVAAGISWTVSSNFVEHYRVIGMTGDTRYSGGVTGDMIHLSGWHSNVLIDGIQGAANDNLVGMTIDINGPGTNHYPNFFFPYQNPGDMYDVTVRNCAGVCEGTSNTFAIVALYGPSAYGYHGVTIDNISGQGNAGVQIANYDNTNMLNTQGENLLIRNIHMANQSAYAVSFNPSSLVNWVDVTIEDVNTQSVAQEAIGFFGSGTLTKCSIKNVYFGPVAFSRSFPLITLGGAVNFKALDISNIEQGSVATTVAMISHTGTGTIGKLAVENVSAIGASGAGTALYSATGSGAVLSALFSNCNYAGAGSTGALFVQGASAAYTTVSFRDCQVSGANGLFVGANTTAAITVYVNNLTLAAGTANAYACVFAGPTNLFVNGYAEVQAPTNSPFQALTSGKAYAFNIINATTSKADMLSITAGANVRANGTGVKTAVGNLASIANGSLAGDIVYDITAGRLSVKNSTLATWTALGA